MFYCTIQSYCANWNMSDHLADEIEWMNTRWMPLVAERLWLCSQADSQVALRRRVSTHRRVILNLSAPNDLSVNSGIPTDSYLGIPFKLKLPSARDFKALIIQHGPGCLLWSHDLSRGYRQLRSDPLDWPLLGIQWQGKYYFDCSIPFGLRFGAKCMQDTTSAVATILQHEGFPTQGCTKTPSQRIKDSYEHVCYCTN